MACGCSGIRSLGDAGPDGLGLFAGGGILDPTVSGRPAFAGNGYGAVGPDGLGDAGKPALLGTVTGNVALDAAALGAIGWFIAPNEKDRKVWAAGGAAAGLLAGTIGLIGLVGLAFYQRRER